MDEIGAAEARGVDFSKLARSIQSVRPSTEPGRISQVVKYSDSQGMKYVIHEVIDGNGVLLHRDFDSIRILSGQIINKIGG